MEKCKYIENRKYLRGYSEGLLFFTNVQLQFVSFSCCNSSDDLLNYEIGEVDDNDLIGADEDELLLSDDGK